MATAVETLSIPTGVLTVKSGVKIRKKTHNRNKTFYRSALDQFNFNKKYIWLRLNFTFQSGDTGEAKQPST